MSRLQRAKHDAAMAELRKRMVEEERKARLDAVRIRAEMARCYSASKSKTPQKAGHTKTLSHSPDTPNRGILNKTSPSHEELERVRVYIFPCPLIVQARRRAAQRIKQTKEQMRQKEQREIADIQAKERKKWEERDKKVVQY